MMKIIKSALLLLGIWLTACTSNLTRDGQSDYRIVISDPTDTVQQKAAADLQFYLNKMSAVVLPIEKVKGEKNIFIGRPHEAPKEIAAFDQKQLQKDGFYLKTLQNDLYILGGSEKGVLYGVYELLEQLGCRQYTAEVQYIPEQSKVKLPQLDDLQVPVIKYREVMYHNTKNATYRDWHRLDVSLHGEERQEWGYWCHSSFDLVDPAIYFDKHPEYFAEVNGIRIPSTQLCTTNPEVVQIVVNRLREEMAKKPEAKYWSVSQEDTYGWCTCENCKAINEKEGTPMGAILHLVNQVADSFPDKVISTLAYEYSRRPPKYLKPRPNVNIMLCSIECNRSVPIAEDPGSADFKEELLAWDKICDNILVWDYVIQFKHLVSPFPNFHVLQPNLQLFAEHGGIAEFQQGNRETGGEFAELRAYLIAKLLWNPDADVKALTSDFLQGYYGEAGRFIQRYIDTMTDALVASGEGMGIFGNPVVAKNSYLTSDLLQQYAALFDQAEAAVANDSVLLERVKICRLPLLYAQLEQAKADPFGPNGWFKKEGDHWVKSATLLQMLKSFTEIANRQGISRVHEWDTTVDEYYHETMQFIDFDPATNKAFRAKIEGTAPEEKYAHNGITDLTNGIAGTVDWNNHWLGYQGKDLEYVIILDKSQDITAVETSFIQDAGSWIFYPQKVQAFTSNDGVTYTPFAKATIPAQRKAPKKKTVTLTGKAKGQYVKLLVKSVKTCPAWHIGVGNASWTFMDEIVVR
ncbi:DUF4838 domain-containing protein [Marinilabiliaceae bacterium JC017]|nr:DUF4838 domain-containing protein [Marinilabiliaceae bacterium JC017]